jgi:hypothetical protein
MGTSLPSPAPSSSASVEPRFDIAVLCLGYELNCTFVVGVCSSVKGKRVWIQFHPGKNVGLGRDYTIYSLIDGLVKFEKHGPDRKKVQ